MQTEEQSERHLAHEAALPGVMRRLLLRVIDGAGYAAALCLLLICVLMIIQSVGRKAGWPVSGVIDIVAWLCAATAFLAMAHAFKHGDFVRVTLLLDNLSATARRKLDISALAIAAVATGYLTFWAVSFTYDSWAIKDMAGGVLVVPLWIPQLSFVVGAVLLMLAVFDELWLVMQGQKPTYVRLAEERHARGDFSEDL